MDRDQAHKCIEEAIDALGRGDKDTAQRLAERASTLAPDWETPWLILSIRANPDEKLALIQKALQINPESHTAQQALLWELERQQARQAEVESSPGPVELQSSRKKKRSARENKQATRPTKERIARAISVEPEILEGQIPPPDFPDIILESPEGKVEPLPIEKKRIKPSAAPIRTYLFAPLGLALLALIVGLSFLLRPQITTLLANFFPAKGCTPTLVLGTRSFEIRTLKPGSDGLPVVPGNQPDFAYWVENTNTNVVLGLSPIPGNKSLVASINTGNTASITWSNCNSTNYDLQPPAREYSNSKSLMDQSLSRITIFIPTDSGPGGLVLRGQLLGETINNSNTPEFSSQQAEISLLETTASPDGSTLTVLISIANNGQATLLLDTRDVLLTPEGSPPVTPERIQPSPPVKIEPGTAKAIYLIFPLPSASSSTLKVLAVEFILEGY